MESIYCVSIIHHGGLRGVFSICSYLFHFFPPILNQIFLDQLFPITHFHFS